MAYTIISQNNNTTTLTDGVNTITVPSRVNLTSGNFTLVEVNNNMATLEDGDGNVYRDIPCVATLVDAGGGGGAVDSVNGKTGTVVLDAKDVHAVPQYTTMPTADSTNVGEIAQFAGTTDATYTNGYIYENVATTTSSSATASQTTGSSLSDVAVVLATFETQITTSGSYAFTSDGTNWSYDGNTVDLTDYGITYTGTPVADDVITVVYTESSTTYAWTRIDVQPSPNPLPSQTGQSGKFLTTDGTDASWAAVNALQNTATGTLSFATGNATATGNYSLALGDRASATANSCVALGESTVATKEGSVLINARSSQSKRCVVIGRVQADSMKEGSVLINSTSSGANMGLTNANSFYIMNLNGLYELLSSDGTIPTDRLPKAINKYSTMPTAAAGNEGWIVQFTGTTDATYTHGYIYECVSDGGNPATYSWTAVQVQAGGGGGLQNTATGTDGLTILGTASTVNYSINIGVNSKVSQTSGVAIGRGSEARAYQSSKLGTAIGTNAFVEGEAGVAIGANSCSYTNASGYAVAIGGFATAYDYGIAIGTRTQVFNNAHGAIQLGNCWTNDITPTQNLDAHTFKVGLRTGTNYELLSSDGTIPTARLTKVNTTVTLTVAGWSGGSQTVTVTGVTSTSVVLVAPDPSDTADYVSAGILCTSQTTDSLTFTATTTPTSDIDVNIVCL